MPKKKDDKLAYAVGRVCGLVIVALVVTLAVAATIKVMQLLFW